MFRLIAIDFSQKSPHFSLLSPTSPCELSEREVTSPFNLKVVGALDNYSLVFVIFLKNFGQLKDWVGQVLFLASCPKGQVEKYANVEACKLHKSFCFWWWNRNEKQKYNTDINICTNKSGPFIHESEHETGSGTCNHPQFRFEKIGSL
jgi:hypothetical protein